MNILLSINNWKFVLDMLGEKYQFRYDKEIVYKDIEHYFNFPCDLYQLLYVTLDEENKIMCFIKTLEKPTLEVKSLIVSLTTN